MIVSSIFVIVLVKSGVTDSTGLDNNVTSWNMRDNSFIGINILIAVLLDTPFVIAELLSLSLLTVIVGRSITDSSSVDCSAKAVMLLAGLLICFSVCWHYCYCLAYW